MKKREKRRVAKASATISEEDRLSVLPDSLLIHILSFLDTKYAVQTCALSKRWINIWKSVSNFTFNTALFKKISAFTKFIDQFLIFHGDAVKVNSMNFICTQSFRRYIWDEREYRHLPFKKLINYAKTHNVQDLNFSIKKYGPFPFADFLYSCSSLKTLSLRITGPQENFEKTFCFTQLLTLHLEGVWLIKSSPFSGCPNLEDLTLIDCDSGCGLHPLTISAPKLSRLTVISSKNCGYGINDIILLTDKLTSFDYHGILPPLLSPNDLPLLDNLTINLYPDRVMVKEKHGMDLINTLKVLHKTKSFALSCGTVKLLAAVTDKLGQEASPISNLKCLSFIRSKGRDSFNIPAHVMTYLLKDTPNAEVVFILPRRYKHHRRRWIHGYGYLMRYAMHKATVALRYNTSKHSG